MTKSFYLYLAVAIFSATALLQSIFHSRSARLAMRRFRAVSRPRTDAASQGELSTPRLLAGRMHQLRTRLPLRENQAVRIRVRQAGYAGTYAYDVYLVGRLLCPTLGLCLGLLLPSHPIIFAATLGGLGYLLPDVCLRRLARRYSQIIRDSLPDAVDLLVICVDAGLGIDQGLFRVCQELAVSHPQITTEFLQIYREERAGKSRTQAWQDFSLRLPIPELQSFTNMLAQTERFGSPVARALSTFAKEMRHKRKQQAEEKAAKTTIKIVFPLVLFIFPSIFLVILGPAFLHIVRGLRGLGH